MLSPLRAPASYRIKEEISVGEAITLLTLGSVFGAAIYNAGFFLHVDSGLSALLSVPDLLWGILFSGTTIVVTFAVMPTYFTWARWAEDTSLMWLAVAASAITALFAVVAFVWIPPAYVINAFALTLPPLFLLAGIAKRFTRWRFFDEAVAIAVSIYVIFFSGISSFYFNANNHDKKEFDIVLREGTTLTAKILKETSSYLFLSSNGRFVVLPLADVSQISVSLNYSRP